MGGRLIEIQAGQNLPTSLAVRCGDLLVFDASGGHVQSGFESVELLGVYLKSLLVDGNQVLSPIGAPNTVVFQACHAGAATIDVVTGDPWHDPKTVPLSITVEP